MGVTLVDWLAARADSTPDLPIAAVLSDAAPAAELTCAALWQRARAIGGDLQRAGARGACVIVPSPSTVDAIVAFWGAICAGAIPVPVPPLSRRHTDRLDAIVSACNPSAIVAAGADRDVIAASAALGTLTFVDASSADAAAAVTWQPPADSTRVAFLQYTSGSTAAPKGVMVTHANLAANARRMAETFGLDHETRCVSWLPFYHDMGLIGGVIQAVYTGYRAFVLSPAAFVERPLRWLEAISAHRATVSGGPNFGYELAARALENSSLTNVDVRSWRVAFCGAEPVRAGTLRRFTRAAQPYGFADGALRPCYGLAEATLLVSVGRWRDEAHEPPEANELAAGSRVGLGAPADGLSVAIVDPDTRRRVADGESGEVWIAGDSVADGYWQQPASTRDTFGAQIDGDNDGTWLRTGDIGALRGGELIVLDRLKDLIIVRGANYWTHDLEAAVEHCHPGVRTHATAAIGVVVDAEERVIILAESERGLAESDVEALCAAVRHTLARRFQLFAHEIVLLRRGTIPRTSSGKVQRSVCRAAYEAGTLAVVARSAALPPDESPSLAADQRPIAIRDEVLRIVADAMGVRPADVPVDEALGSLGVDSLRLTQAKMALDRVAREPIAYSALVDRTVNELASTLADGDDPRVSTTLTAATPATEAPLSIGQRALWFLNELQPDANTYCIVRAFVMHGELDDAALAAACARVSARHQALRTVVAVVDGELVQRFTSGMSCELRDATDWDVERLHDEMTALARVPIDLQAGPLLMLHVFRRAASEHWLLFRAHHLSVDLWSLGLVLDELERAYRDAAAAVAPAPAAAFDYADYVSWQRALVASEAGERLATFWFDRLKDHAQPVRLPARRAGASIAGAAGRCTFDLDAATTERVKRLARAHGTTLNAAIVTAFEILLARACGQDRFLVGTLASGRTRSELAGVVGYCVNLLPLRAAVTAAQSVTDLLRATRDELNTALEGQDLPFGAMVQRLRPEREGDRSPLVRAVCVCQPSAVLPGRDIGALVLNRDGGRLRFADLELESIAVEEVGAQFDLMVAVTERADGFQGTLQYDASRLDAGAAESMTRGLCTILREMAAAPSRRVGEIPVVDRAAYLARAAEWNDTACAIAPPYGVHEIISQQAAVTPTATAIVHRGAEWSYADLMSSAGACAARLRRAGVGPEVRVGLAVERSPHMVAALLGVLQAGGAYVPLDPAHPSERLARIVRDASPLAIIVSGETSGLFASADLPLLFVDELCDPLGESSPPPIAAEPDAAAYVMYTSGSTGAPKGVVVSHRNVANLFAGLDRSVGCSAADTLVAVTSIAFDISVLELLWTLARGARVIIADDARLAPAPARRRRLREMAFSLFYFAATDDNDGAGKYELLFEGAKYGDQHGFAAVWTPERHFHPFGGLYPNPSVTSAALAAVTTRLRLRAGSVVLPLHHPIRVAEEWSVVDNISGGRVDVAFASGWHAEDFAFCPADYESRRDIMFERIDTVRRLWRGERVAVEDGDRRERTVALFPRPVQRELPIWLTAAGSPDTFRAAGRLSANVLTHLLGQDADALRGKIAIYRDALAEHGLDAGAFGVTLMLHAYVDDTFDRTRARALGPFKQYLRSSLDLVTRLIKRLQLDLDVDRMSPRDLDDLIAFAAERYMRDSGLFGPPDACLAVLDRIADCGVDEVACLIDFGVDRDAALASLARLTAVKERFNRAVERVDAADRSIAALAAGATMIQCTPSMASMLLAAEPIRDRFAAMRVVMLGGEPVPAGLVGDLGSPARCLNMYGPTETTVWSAVSALTPDATQIAIGGPISNTTLHVLDADARPLPDGSVGELWIGGLGVARGYWNAPAATAARFQPDPFSRDAGARFYRTGDRARRLDDGSIELLGRADQQVKIRGHRVELGEIETALNAEPTVRVSAVVARRDERRGQELVAYVVPLEDTACDLDYLRSALAARLPAAMVPTLVRLEELPVTPNGKIDRQQLVARAVVRPARVTAPRQPQTETEALVRRIWQDVLGIEDVATDANFFEVGGHSLLIAQVHERLQRAAGTTVPLVALLEHPTIAGIAACLEQRTRPIAADASRRALDQRRALRAHARPTAAGRAPVVSS